MASKSPSVAKRILTAVVFIAVVAFAIEGGEFGRLLLSVWLGPDSADFQLKNGMLGKVR